MAGSAVGVQQLSNKRLRTRMDFDGGKSCAYARCAPPRRSSVIQCQAVVS
jgi:hypothetical protein